MPRATRRRSIPPWCATLALVLGIAVVHALSPSPQSGDSRLSLVVAWQLLTTGSVDLAHVPAVTSLTWHGDLIPTADGRLVPFFPWPPMLLALPGALILALLGHDPAAVSISDPNLTWIVEVPTAGVLVAITAAVLRRIVLDAGRTWSTPAVGLLTALGFAFTTIAWSAGSRALWQQTVSMLVLALLVLALQRVTRGGRWPWLAGALTALAFIVRPTNAVVALLVITWTLVTLRRAAWRPALAATAVGLVFLAASWLLVGTPLPDYYLPSRLASDPVYPFGESLGVHLVSPARGLLVYVPLVIVATATTVVRAVRRDLGGLDLVLAGSVVLQILVIAKFGSTDGFTVGPRLLLDVVPFVVLLAAPALALVTTRTTAGPTPVRRTLAAVGVALALGAGLFVNASSAVSRDAVCWNVSPAHIDDAPSRVWDAADPPFLRPWRALAAGDGLTLGPCPPP